MASNVVEKLHDWSLDDDVTQSIPADEEVDVLKTTENPIVSDGHDKTALKNTHHKSDDVDYTFGDGRLRGLLSDVIDDDEISTSESIDVNPFDDLPYSSMYYELMRKRQALPVWKAKDDFVLAVEESSVILVTGRAGSGKSTQIPHWCVQFAHETNFEFGTVVCTQPSPHSAMSLAIQVAHEMDLTDIGNAVGYEIPQVDCTCENTVLKFCTDDLLLREMADDPLLQKYNFVVIDEVQERTIATDMLLALIKSLQNARDDLKVVIISLSHEMPRLEEFFEEVPIVDLHFLEENFSNKNTEEEMCKEECKAGRSEDAERKRREELERKKEEQIDIHYHPLDGASLIKTIVSLVITLHCAQDIKGDFLVFLPTKQDIEESCDHIARDVAMKSLRGEAGEIIVLPLHKDLSYGAQQAVYDRKIDISEQTNLRKRRVIVADELAESCFSMENIDVIIDSGVKFEEIFNCRTRTRSRNTRFISRTSATLRSDRCSSGGRVYRMYTEKQFKEMDMNATACIKRIELTSHVLLLKRLLQRLNINFSQCQFIEPPDPESYMLALEELDYHGALDESGNLSDLGAVMSEFPLSVPQAKCVIASCGEDCVQEILTIVAMATSTSWKLIPRGFEEEATSLHRHMSHKAGDHFTFLNIYHRFIRYKRSESWCLKNYINYDSLMTAEKMRTELLRIMESLELPISESIIVPDQLESSVKKALLAGYFMQVARDTDGCGNYHIIRDKHVARLHPNSNMHRHHEWVLYNEFLLTENSFLTTVSGVTANWISEITPQSYLVNLPQNESKDLLLKLSARRRRRALLEAKYEADAQRRDAQNTSDANDVQKMKSTSPGDAYDVDDTDVLTQAARSMSFAYHHAANYVANVEDDETDSQCVVQ